MTRALPHKRLLVLIGQAGDRGDESIRGLATATAEMNPDRVLLKEMTEHLRGRQPGEVVALMRKHLTAAGQAQTSIRVATSEVAGVRDALDWAQEEDLLLLLSHASRREVLHLLQTLVDTQWLPGTGLPAASTP